MLEELIGKPQVDAVIPIKQFLLDNTCFHQAPAEVDDCPDRTAPILGQTRVERMDGGDFDPDWDEEESYTKELRDLDESPDDYVVFSQMSSSQAYTVMEDFANSLPVGTLKVDLLNALNQKGPFQHFKRIVESSIGRQEWFDYRDSAYAEYVREEFDWQMESE